MKRPPDRKLLLAATILLVAAGMVLARPAIGTDPGASTLLIAKVFGK